MCRGDNFFFASFVYMIFVAGAGLIVAAAMLMSVKAPLSSIIQPTPPPQKISLETAKSVLRRALPADEFIVDVLEATSYGERIVIVAKLSTFDVVLLQSIELDGRFNMTSRTHVTPFNGSYIPLKNL